MTSELARRGQGRAMATIYDVAREAGVSIATVSNVLNRPERVAAATRERVMVAAEALSYVPKSEAASRARMRLRRVAVAAPFSAYPSYLRRLVGILGASAELGVEVTLIDEQSAALSPSPVLATLPVRGSVDGVIVMGQPLGESIEERLGRRGVPVVVVDTTSSRFGSVVMDDIEGGRQAAGHLVSLGHRRVGYILEGQASDYPSQALHRLDGVREVVAAAGGEVVVVSCGGSIDEGARAARALLDGDGRVTAIMAHYDELAIGALDTLRERALRVPDDVSVMGYDDGALALAAGLSTIRQPFEESGAVATELLHRSLAGRPVRSVTVLPTQLVARRTTGPAADVSGD